MFCMGNVGKRHFFSLCGNIYVPLPSTNDLGKWIFTYNFMIVRRGYNQVLPLITYNEKNILKIVLSKP